jgi:osmotically-inducible protein OsmY
MRKNNPANATVIPAVALFLLIGCASTQPVGDQLSDRGITTRIQSKLTADPEVSPFNVDVDTLEGVVTLRGEVEKPAARDEAEKHARNTRGVRDVHNQIRVVSSEHEDDERVSDAWITTKVKSKLIADPQLNPFNIDVDTEDGYVTL